MVKYLDKNIYFCSGRTALYNGIILSNLNKKKIILLPEIICKEILIPFKKLNIKYKFYELDDQLKPKWSKLNKLKLKNISSIMMIHYFGFPSDISKFKKYTKKNKIFLIEDYCHGYDGYYKSKKLGSFGHISIMSPKKIIKELYSGGVLKLNFNIKKKKVNLEKKTINLFQLFIQKIKNLYIVNNIKIFIKNIKIRPSKIIHNDNVFENKLIDDMSLKIIKEKNYSLKYRVDQYKILYNFLKKNNIDPNYNLNKKDKIIPWHIPFYLKKNEYLNFKKIIKKANLNIIQWPSIPNELKHDLNIKKKYSELYCITIK